MKKDFEPDSDGLFSRVTHVSSRPDRTFSARIEGHELTFGAGDIRTALAGISRLIQDLGCARPPARRPHDFLIRDDATPRPCECGREVDCHAATLDAMQAEENFRPG